MTELRRMESSSPFHEIAQVDRPGGVFESLLHADGQKVLEKVLPVSGVGEQHDDAGHAAVPIVLLLVVAGHVTSLAWSDRIHSQ